MIKNINVNTALIKSEFTDYFVIFMSLLGYSFAWALFLLPYQISSGGVTGAAAIVFYATGIPLQYTNLVVNAVLLLIAFKALGMKFILKTGYAILALTFTLAIAQEVCFSYVTADVYGNLPDGTRVPLILGEGQEFMACLIGSIMSGAGIAFVFLHNGSTGGTDIIAALVNKYRDISLGAVLRIVDFLIISSCYLVFHSWQRVIFGFVTLFVSSLALDYTINSYRRSVQFFIFSSRYEEIADRINKETRRGVTVLDGTGWYSKQPVKVLCVMAKKRQSAGIFRLVKQIDPNAFVSQSAVMGVYGQGFDMIKVKA